MLFWIQTWQTRDWIVCKCHIADDQLLKKDALEALIAANKLNMKGWINSDEDMMNFKIDKQ